MIVKDVRLKTSKDTSVLSAQCKIRKIGWDTVYFSINSSKESYIVADASPFAAVLLIPSMRLGENLIIKGSISKQLYDGLHEVMEEMLSWGINLKRIAIKADSLIEDEFQPKNTASFFTGGVDSFYTYLKHKNDPAQGDRINSFVFVKGFDIKINDEKLWNVSLKNITAIAKAENIEVVTVESNIREIVEPMLLWDFMWFYPWDYIHGSCLAATGLFLRNTFRKIYVPSTFSVQEQLPWGSHMNVDKHWSTESLAFVHDGTEATRLEKIISQVAKSPVALKYLRVCYVNPNGSYNCGTCDKCLRTMTSFFIAGVLDKMDTFPHSIDLKRVAKSPLHLGDGELIVYGEQQNLDYLKASKLDPQLQEAIQAGIDNAASKKSGKKDKLKIEILKLKAKGTYFDHAYFGGYSYTLLNNIFGKN